MVAGKSPPLYHGHEELKRTVEEDFPKAVADLEALLRTNLLSSTVEAGCFWRLLCTLLLFSFSVLPHPSYIYSQNQHSWAPEEISSWSGGEDLESMARKHSLCLCSKEWPLLSTVFLCELGKVGHLFLTSWVTIFRRFLHPAYRWKCNNGH